MHLTTTSALKKLALYTVPYAPLPIALSGSIATGGAVLASRVSRACLARCPLRLRESDLFPAAPHRAFRAALPHLGKSKGVETRVSERATFSPR